MFGGAAFVRLCMLTFVRILDVGICPTTFLLCWHLSDYFSPMLAFVRKLFSYVGICPTLYVDICPNFRCWHLSDYFSPMLAFVRLLFFYVGICPTLYVDICPNFRCWHLSDYFSSMLAFVRLLFSYDTINSEYFIEAKYDNNVK